MPVNRAMTCIDPFGVQVMPALDNRKREAETVDPPSIPAHFLNQHHRGIPTQVDSHDGMSF